ncbi:MAG: isoleucine--tRNA ligase [Deltaproteobacteria bacterium]|nr:isoleucine--tRNA ligase [Deltaproteobacteria bacterium]
MKTVDGELSFSALEKEILEEWQNHKTFACQNEQRKDAEVFSFYDGPPFANGLPHYGHLLANTIKDTVPRYWVMRGYRVDRRFGWDCHGLPVEFEIEKRESLKGRPDILRLGVPQFNEMCRESVLHYTGEWRKTITRLGRWVDWDQQYRTMDRDFMESVWWVFSELYRKNLVYQDFKVVPYSPRTSSVVSNFEANQNYKDVQDPSLVVRFRLKDDEAYLLAWTTTPWTLPTNLALAVGKDIHYVRVRDRSSGEVWILAQDRLDFVFRQGKHKKGASDEPAWDILSSVTAESLAGLSYEPLFPYFNDQPEAFRVLLADFVATDNGTGIVHLAPCFGEDDFRVCRDHGIAIADSLDDAGCFSAKVPDYEGLYFKDADKVICRDLKQRGQLLWQDTLVHSYPFDERTDTHLIYRAVPSWYVAVETCVDKLLRNNQQINWVPEHLRDGRMGNWLKNARDWAISRNRFWGTPLPVWLCDQHPDEHREVMSSVRDLEEKTGKEIPDIHKHFIQDLTFPCGHCSGTMRAVDVVFDCWFESGSMPYAQQHYPFKNKENFHGIFPADFVAEGLDQTRGWFYTLNVLSTALFDTPAFKNVVVNGTILDERGKKMSKRHKNYTPPDELIETWGADSVRLYMLNSPLLKGENLMFADKGVRDVTRAILLPLWNAYRFLVTYAHADQWAPEAELLKGHPPKLHQASDRWMVSVLQSLMATVHQHMEEYRLYLVVPAVVSFVDDLTNWYIRLNRRRFWGNTEAEGISQDQHEACSCLFYVLLEFSKILAPFAPFISDRIYKNLTDKDPEVPQSVHLCDYPLPREELRDEALERQTELVRRVTLLGRSLRQQYKIRTRQALASMTVIARRDEECQSIAAGIGLLKEELNVKQVDLTTDEAGHVGLSVRANLKNLGKRLGKGLQAFRQALGALNESREQVADLLAELDEKGEVCFAGVLLSPDDLLVDRLAPDGCQIATERELTVLLDTRLTPELIAEGYARELVNRIQNFRKDSQLNVSDRIRLQLWLPQILEEAANSFQEYILAETLGTELRLMNGAESCDYRFRQQCDIEGMACTLALETVP